MHIGVGPCENVLVLLERLLDVSRLTGFQEGTSISETIFSL